MRIYTNEVNHINVLGFTPDDITSWGFNPDSVLRRESAETDRFLKYLYENFTEELTQGFGKSDDTKMNIFKSCFGLIVVSASSSKGKTYNRLNEDMKNTIAAAFVKIEDSNDIQQITEETIAYMANFDVKSSEVYAECMHNIKLCLS